MRIILLAEVSCFGPFSVFNYVGDNKATTLYSRDIRYFLLLCLFIKQIKCVQGITYYI